MCATEDLSRPSDLWVASLPTPRTLPCCSLTRRRADRDAARFRRPITGNTPITLRGIGFVQSSQVQVKFSDGRREANVPGKYISSSEITCNTPSFEKFGPLEVMAPISPAISARSPPDLPPDLRSTSPPPPRQVMVRVAIKGDPFTVNKAMFSFFVNTKAGRCMAFGPGLVPSKAGLAGRMTSFIMTTKDSTGKARSSGGDSLNVQIVSELVSEEVPPP